MSNKMPTVQNLVDEYTGSENSWISVKYNHSQVIRTNRNVTVWGYGKGYGGFISVFPDKNGKPRAYRWGFKYEFYQDGGAQEIDVKYALKELKENKFLTEVKVDERYIDLNKLKAKNEPNILGELTVKVNRKYQHINDTYLLTLRKMQNKNGSTYFVMNDRWTRMPKRTQDYKGIKDFIDIGNGEYETSEKNPSWYSYDYITVREVITNTITDEIKDEIVAKLFAEAI